MILSLKILTSLRCCEYDYVQFNQIFSILRGLEEGC